MPLTFRTTYLSLPLTAHYFIPKKKYNCMEPVPSLYKRLSHQYLGESLFGLVQWSTRAIQEGTRVQRNDQTGFSMFPSVGGERKLL